MSVLVAENLCKKIKDNEVVRNFSYNFLDNQVYAILEKSEESEHHLLNLISSKEKCDKGRVWIDGEELYGNIEMNERICYISKDATFPRTLKIVDIFKIMEDFYPKWDNNYAYELIKHYEIPLNEKYGKLSLAKKEILIGLISLASRANITIFERPLNDADIKERYDFFDYLYKHHVVYPRTIIITTPFVDDIDFLIDKVLFVDRGRLFAHFTINEIKDNFRYLSGKTEVLKSIIGGVKLLGAEERNDIFTVCVRQKLSKDEIRKYQKYLIKISEVPIYNVFIYLINLRKIREKL